MPLRPGETFGRYQLAEILGRGAMGEVYSAYDTVLHRKVALKVLTVAAGPFGEGPPSTKGAARILREARAAAGITHPNAVSIYDVGEVDGISFLAMELVLGRTLRAFIGDHATPLARRIRWVADVARALGAAHELGLVHRDIKPENVMVRDDGFVKVLDFGIARRAIASDEAAPSNPTDLAALAKFAVTNGTLTAEGVVVGTPMYMAPEQMRGEALDGRADQFAWGVLAYEVLSGKLPWDGEGVAMLSQILSKEAAPLADVSPDIPPRVDAVVRRALSKVPGSRFPKMEEIADELEPYAASAGGAAGRPERVAISVRDPALAATEQIPSSANGPLLQTGAHARTQPESPQLTRSRGRAGVVGVAAVATVIAVAGVWGGRAFAPARSVDPVVDAAAVADAPSQVSTNPDATAAYRAGMQALRDGSMGSANKQLGRAVELDPLFAAAHLRLALARLLGIDTSSITSADLQGARDSQASLGTHDRILLDAFEPMTLVPPDLKESERRLEAAAQKYPGDPDFPFQLGQVLDIDMQPAKAATAFDASIKNDPTFAFAWRMKGDVDVEIDDLPGAFAAFAQCLKVSPGATTCLADLIKIQANEGKCRELVDTSRRLIALVPEAPEAYFALAEALFSTGEAIDSVHAALQQAWELDPPATRRFSQLMSEASLALLTGDFLGADRRYDELEKLTASDPTYAADASIPYIRVLLNLEIGRTAEANRVAALHLRQRAAWSGSSYPSLALYAAERAAGGITRAKFDEVRVRWLGENQGAEPGYRWVDAYALPAETPEEATAALAEQPSVRPLVNALFMAPNYAEPIGRAYFLAGRLDEAIPLLSQAATSCSLVDGKGAMFTPRAAYELGRALEARGDNAGACAAYGRVVARWGASVPPSRTAASAMTRRRALACAP